LSITDRRVCLVWRNFTFDGTGHATHQQTSMIRQCIGNLDLSSDAVHAKQPARPGLALPGC
jgi:hypothetical protein